MQPTEAWQRGNDSSRSGEAGSPPLPDDSRINAAVEEYLALLQGEQMPSRRAFLARYPELAPALDECLAALDFLRSAAPQLNQDGAEAAPLAADERPTATLGDFRILREIGRGGMGVVYEAEQLSLGRRVALKVLPFAAALDAKQLQRFKNEAQTAAHLHHTNIVPVHYVGCERGVHFYAMQFIDGQSLAEVIDTLRCSAEAVTGPAAALAGELSSGRWAPPQPARPAQPAAGAASPSPDGSLAPASTAPRVRLATERSTKQPVFFRTVARLGEQAAEALDHAHQLGVIHRDIKPANLLVDVRGNLWVTDFGLAQFQSEVKLTPTGNLLGTYRYMSPEQALAKRVTVDHRTDIYSLGVTLYELLTLEPACNGRDREAVLRQIAFDEPRAPRRLNKALPVELETIVLKAMAKDPNSRYATAQELADDLRRFLDDKPIRARRPSLLQRVSRWSRRHQGLVRAGAVFLVLAVVGLAVSNLLIGRERDRKGEALEGMSREKERADLNLARARKAVEDYLTKVTENPKLKAADFHALRKDLLATAVPFYEEFVKQKQDDPVLETDRGLASGKLALVRLEMGESEQAVADYQQARAIFARLAEDFPSVREHRVNLAVSHYHLGILLRDLGKLTEAEAAYREALTIFEKLATDVSTTITGYRRELSAIPDGLGDVLRALGKWATAEAAYRQALASRKRLAADFPAVPIYRQDLAQSHNNLGILLRDLGKLAEAEALHLQALAIFEKLANDFSTIPDYRHGLAHSHSNLRNVLYDLGKWAEASAAERKALAIREQLATDFPAVPEYRKDLAASQDNLAALFRQMGKPVEGMAACQQALTIRTKLAAECPNVSAHRQHLAQSHGNMGIFLLDLGNYAEALTACRQALAIQEKLATEFPAVPEYGWELARNHSNLGALFHKLGKLAEAEAEIRRSLAIQKQLDANLPTHRLALARSYHNLGYILSDVGKGGEAEAASREAVAILEKLAADFPAIPEYRQQLAENHNNLGLLLRSLGKREDAEAALRQALALRAKLVADFSAVPVHRQNLAASHFNLGLVLQDLSKWAEAEAAYRQAAVISEDIVKKFPSVPEYQSDLARDHNNLAWFLATCPDPKFRKVAEAVTLAKQVVKVGPEEGGNWNTLGVAQFRAGDYQVALEALQKSMQLSKGGTSSDWFFLAMAHWQLGDKEQSRKWYHQAVQWMEKNQPQDVDLRRFRAEAAELLGIKRAPPCKDKDKD